MIIPLGSDAPLYHRPFATLAVMAINVLAYLIVPRDAYQDYALVLGDGVHPLQWLTNNFLHTGFFHLAGNLVFLWTFGLVVEGKLGWWRFALVYVLLGTLESGALQVLVPSEREVAMMGSSRIVFGLMGMCLVWAPRNEVTCVLWLRLTPIEFDVSILWFAAMYIALDVFSGGLSGVVRASLTNLSRGVIVAMMLDHTVGAILGILLGMAMVKLKWVDCENWDLFAVLERRAGRPRSRVPGTRKAERLVSSEYRPADKPRAKKKDAAEANGVRSVEDRAAARLRTLRQHLKTGEAEAALAVYLKARRSPAGWQPPQLEWRSLLELLLEIEAWEDAVVVMRDYLRELPEPAPRVRLKLAQVLIQKMERPAQGLKVLGQIPAGSLPENLEAVRIRLVRRAEALREEGTLELDEDPC
jgi:membrane associated rhomboid family serine protease